MKFTVERSVLTKAMTLADSVIEAGMCIALGKHFLGHPVRQGLVIYQAGEGARGIKNRFRAVRSHFGIPHDAALPLVLLQNRIDLFSEEGDTQGFIDEVQSIRAMFDVPMQVIFIDTLAKAQGFADENNGRDMGRVLDHIDKIREATGVAICLVHHLNADGTKLRGHTSVFANIDQVLGVTCDKETKVRTVRTSKMKDGSDDVQIRFELKSVRLGEDSRGKEITSCVVLPLGEKEALRAVENSYKARDNERQFLNAFFKALADDGEAPPPGMVEIPETVRRVVNVKALRRTFAAMSISGDEDERKAYNRQRAAFKRAADWLQTHNVIAAHLPYVWWTGRVVHGVPQTYPEKRPEKPNSSMRPDDDLPF